MHFHLIYFEKPNVYQLLQYHQVFGTNSQILFHSNWTNSSCITSTRPRSSNISCIKFGNMQNAHNIIKILMLRPSSYSLRYFSHYLSKGMVDFLWTSMGVILYLLLNLLLFMFLHWLFIYKIYLFLFILKLVFVLAYLKVGMLGRVSH